MDPVIEKRITIAAVLAGYPKESLLFVLQGMPPSETITQHHIDGETLCWRLHDYALHLYGVEAREQLKEWKIETTSDCGQIVFALIEHGFLSRTETDDIEDFNNVFDFEAHFDKPNYTNEKPLHQWNLFALFIVTTLAAIAFSGFSRNGFDGVVSALFSSWFVMMGVACIVLGVTDRSKSSLLLVSFGIVSFAAGLFSFFTFSI